MYGIISFYYTYKQKRLFDMLQTERLTIQELKPEDWIHLKTIVTEFRRSEYALYDMPLPIENDKIKSLCEQFAISKLWFAVWLSNEMIGYICFHQNGTAYDLCYCFHPEYHGYGYANEACSEILRYIEKTRTITTFTAGTALKNTPSCKLLNKLGFVLNGTEPLSFHRDENGNDIYFEGGNFIMQRR